MTTKPKAIARANPLRRAQLRFAVIFAGITSVLLALYSFPYAEHGVRENWFAAYLAMYAQLAGAALRMWESNITVTGAQIDGRTSLLIAKNCDAMDVNILFAAAVLATPVAWSRRALGLVFGVTALVVINILRIVSLYFIRLHWEHSFEFVHAEVWPFALVVIVVLGFLAWSRWATPAPPPAS